MTRISPLSFAALFVMAGSAVLPPQASAQLGKMCGGYVGVKKPYVTSMPGGRTGYSVVLVNEQGKAMSYVLEFSPARPTKPRFAMERRTLKPGQTDRIDLGYSVGVKPLTEEELMQGLRARDCTVAP